MEPKIKAVIVDDETHCRTTVAKSSGSVSLVKSVGIEFSTQLCQLVELLVTNLYLVISIFHRRYFRQKNKKNRPFLGSFNQLDLWKTCHSQDFYLICEIKGGEGEPSLYFLVCLDTQTLRLSLALSKIKRSFIERQKLI